MGAVRRGAYGSRDSQPYCPRYACARHVLVSSSTLSALAVALRLIGRVVLLLGASPVIAVAAAEPACHNGVGWREGSNILFSVYSAPGADQDDLMPLAGFVIERKPSVLKGTVVAEGGSAVPARP